MKKYLSVDVGGTAIKFGILNEEGEVLEKGEIPTPHVELEAYVDTLASIYDRYRGKVEAMVMSAPGRIDSQRGYFYTGGAVTCMVGVDLKERLSDKVDVPFAAENDAKCAALAELWKGSMKGIDNGTVITLGTGLGGALIIGGKLYRGSSFAAGEYSVISTHLDKPYGADSAMWAMQNGVGCMVADYAQRIGIDKSELNGRILFDRANAGEAEALDAIRAYCDKMATGIISLQAIIDVDRVSLGGGISRQPLLLKCMKESVERLYGPFVGVFPQTMPEIVACDFGNDANMIGALYHYLYEMK